MRRWLMMGLMLCACGDAASDGNATSDGEATGDDQAEGAGETAEGGASETNGDGEPTGDGDGDGEPSVCGDNNLEPGEDCDDGNLDDGDGCESDCKYTTPAKKVVTGLRHTCVLFNSGQVKCWGGNDKGQLGYGHNHEIGDDETADQVGFVDIGGVAIDIETGGDATCVLFDDATIGCWGANVAGELGYGHTHTIGDDEVPADAGKVDVGGDVVTLAGGNGRMCAVLDDSSLRCWGYNNMGQLGYGYVDYVGDDETPASAGPVPLGGEVREIAAGLYHTCAKLDDGGVRCWGQSSNGELGQGDTKYIGDDEPASAVAAIDLGGFEVDGLACGGYHCCVRNQAGEVMCWGDNEHGQLGYGHTQDIGDDEVPAVAGLVDVGGPALEFGAEFWATCVRLSEGIKCWGSAAFGQLGYGQPFIIALGDDELPSSYGVVDVGDEITGLSKSSASHLCGVTPTAQLRCWGSNTSGQLGHGIMEFAIGDHEPPSTLPVVPFY